MIASTFLRKLSIAEFINLTHLLESNGRAAKNNAENHKPPLFLRSFAHAKGKFPKDKVKLQAAAFLWQATHFFDVGGAGAKSGRALTTAS
jgi:hypothetical protein